MLHGRSDSRGEPRQRQFWLRLSGGFEGKPAGHPDSGTAAARKVNGVPDGDRRRRVAQAAVTQRPWVCSDRDEMGFATGACFRTTGLEAESFLASCLPVPLDIGHAPFLGFWIVPNN